MLNLIWKDILIQKKVILFYIATICIYLLVGVSPILIGVVYSLVFIVNAFSYDEKGNANVLLNSLPYTRKEIVSSKYIGAIVFTLLIVGVIYTGNFLLNGIEITSIWKEILLLLGIVMLAISFMLPISYKFKTQYLLFASMVLFGLYLLTVNFFIPNLNDGIRRIIQQFITLQEAHLYIFFLLLMIFFYLGSWLLSIRIYEKKVF